MSLQRPDHITEADWEAMTPRKRRRAVAEAREAAMTEEEKVQRDARCQREQFINRLVSAYGGRRWTKGDHDRVYFNEVYVGDLKSGDFTQADGYYDLVADKWVCTRRGVTAEQFAEAIKRGEA